MANATMVMFSPNLTEHLHNPFEVILSGKGNANFPEVIGRYEAMQILKGIQPKEHPYGSVLELHAVGIIRDTEEVLYVNREEGASLCAPLHQVRFREGSAPIYSTIQLSVQPSGIGPHCTLRI